MPADCKSIIAHRCLAASDDQYSRSRITITQQIMNSGEHEDFRKIYH